LRLERDTDGSGEIQPVCIDARCNSPFGFNAMPITAMNRRATVRVTESRCSPFEMDT